MRPLTLDDLMPLNEYAGRRMEFFESHRRYVDRYRRVRVGPRATLIFENRQTLWFRVQEVLRIARLTEPDRIQRQLDVYNRLLPRRDSAQAAVIMDIDNVKQTGFELDLWQTLAGSEVRIRLAGRQLTSELVTCRPEDRAAGAAHYVQFTFDAGARQVLGSFRLPAWCEIAHASYQHQSQPLSEDLRQSLLDDLELSDKDD